MSFRGSGGGTASYRDGTKDTDITMGGDHAAGALLSEAEEEDVNSSVQMDVASKSSRPSTRFGVSCKQFRSNLASFWGYESCACDLCAGSFLRNMRHCLSAQFLLPSTGNSACYGDLRNMRDCLEFFMLNCRTRAFQLCPACLASSHLRTSAPKSR